MPADRGPADKFFLAVVTDESTAVFYTHDSKSGPLSERQRSDNVVARAKTSELISDRGGRSFDSHGHGRHTMAGKSAPKQHAAAEFARQVAAVIGADIASGKCRGYSLIAPPRFLGELRSAVAKATKTEPYATVNKDVVRADASAIADLLATADSA